MVWIPISIVIIGTIIIFWFRYTNKAILTENNMLLQSIEIEIGIHHQQIQTRKAYLKTYHFLKYNLSEALIIQPEIKI